MARKTIPAWELHIEKIVLGVAGLIFVGGIVYFMLLGAPYKVEIWGGQSVALGEVGAELTQSAEKAALPFRNPPKYTRPESDPKAPTGAVTGFSLPTDVKRTLPPLQPPVPPVIEGEDSDSGRGNRTLVTVVAPARPLVRASRNVIELPRDVAFELLATKGVEEGGGRTLGEDKKLHSWVFLTSFIDLAKQEAEFKKALYPPAAWDLTAYKLEVQRRAVTRAAAGDVFGVWQDVPTWLPFATPPLPEMNFAADGSVAPVERQSLRTLWTDLRNVQDFLLRTPRFKTSAGGEFKEPLIPYLRTRSLEHPGFFDAKGTDTQSQEMAAAARAWRDLAKKAMDAKTPEYDWAYMFAEASQWAKGLSARDRDDTLKLLDTIDGKFRASGATPAKREQLRRRMPLVAYDLEPSPGLDYQYRMRLVILNRSAGKPGDFANPADAQNVVIAGEWSEPSDMIRIESDTYMFLTKVDNAKNEAEVQVFRKTGRNTPFESSRFTIKIGDPIGKVVTKGRAKLDFRTGAVVVDIDVDYLYYPPDGSPPEATPAVVFSDGDNPGVLRELILKRPDDSIYNELTGRAEKAPRPAGRRTGG